MQGLIIRQPYIDMILDGRKTWEMRSKRCNRRGQIALIQQGTKTVVGVADVVTQRNRGIAPHTFCSAKTARREISGSTSKEESS